MDYENKSNEPTSLDSCCCGEVSLDDAAQGGLLASAVLSERVLMLFGEGQQVTDPDVVLRNVMWDLRSVGPSIITIPQKLETTF